MKHLTAILLLLGFTGAASSAGLLGQEKQILPMTRANWVAFRNYDGKQWIYFTHLIVYRCGLREIRYSIDSDWLRERFPLPPCDPDNPNAFDPVAYPPYLVLPAGSAATISVQLVYTDREESEVVRFAPCDVADDSTCAVLVE